MDANTIITMIGSLGFPIVACIGIAYFFAKANDNYRLDMKVIKKRSTKCRKLSTIIQGPWNS